MLYIIPARVYCSNSSSRNSCLLAYGIPGPVAVSELPGYPGRQQAQQSRYVTAKFPLEAISTIDQNVTRAMPRLARVWNCL